MDRKQETVDTYNKNAGAMAQKFSDLGARTQDIEKISSLLHKENPLILEIGCGSGRDAKEFLKYTDVYLGIDISQGMIDIAREYAPEARFEVADVEEWEFPQGIDAVVSFASLLHSDRKHVEEILKKVHAALNSEGIFYISLKKGPYSDEGILYIGEFGPRTFFYTPDDIRELAGDLYETLEIDEQILGHGQIWFTIILKTHTKSYEKRI